MQTEKTKHVPYLDGWRGMAIILVLVAHFSPGYGFLPIGALGVLLFFVLSGHFIGKLLFVKKTPLPTFFARRFSRIIPLTWIYISVMYFYARYFMPKTYIPSSEELLSMFFFLGAYIPKDVSIFAGHWPIGQLWSLNVEEHSYIFLAMVFLVIGKFKNRIRQEIFLASIVIIVLLITVMYGIGILHKGASPWRTHTEVASLGLLAAAGLAASPPQSKRWWEVAKWVPVVFVLLAALPFFPFEYFSFSSKVVSLSTAVSLTISPLLAAVAINYSHNLPLIIKNILTFSMLRWFGRVSFSIYIWQQPFFELCHQNGLPSLAGLGLAVTTGAASFYIIEDPCRKYLNERWSKYESQRLTSNALKS